MLKPTTKQRAVSVTKIVVATIGILFGSFESTIAREPQRVVAVPTSQLSSARTQLTIAELKTIYLDCDRNAMGGRLGAAETAACSMVYEELKKRGFDGDFDKFLVWSRAQNSAAR